MAFGIIYYAVRWDEKKKAFTKGYVGQTNRTLDQRRKCHFQDMKTKQGKGSRYFHNALRRYGDSFDWFEVEECPDQETLNAREKHWIEALGTFVDTGHGYNLTTGGGQHKFSGASKAKMSASAKQSYLKDPSRREFIRQIHTGRVHSEEEIEKRTASIRRRWADPEFREKHGRRIQQLWDERSPEARERHAENVRVAWSDPSLREKQSQRMKGRNITWGDKISAAKKDKPLSPGHVEQMRENMRRRMADPVVRERLLQTGFKEGHVPWNKGLKGAQVAWNKGIPTPEETKRKQSKAHEGKTLSAEHRRNIGKTLRGQTRSDEARQNMSKASKGKPKSAKHRQSMSDCRRGKKAGPRSAQAKHNMSEAQRRSWASLSPEEKTERQKRAWATRKKKKQSPGQEDLPFKDDE